MPSKELELGASAHGGAPLVLFQAIIMKKITLSLSLAIAYLGVIGQTNQPPPKNELGVITYSEVVQVEETSKELLLTNAFNYLRSLIDNHKKLKSGPYINEDSTEINLPLAYTVYRDFPVHSPHGVIKYQFPVSVKDGRYRYVATNFVFHYLKRNRYGKFAEVKGKSKPLEELFYKGSQKLWDQHKQQTGDKISILAESLHAEMFLPPEGPKEEIVKVDEDW